MSEQDYSAGKRGESFSPGMDRQAYEAGKSKGEKDKAIAEIGSGPKTQVSGVGFTALLMSPVLAVMYPAAGITVILAVVLAAKLTAFLPKGFQALIVIGVFIFAFLKALKLEHAFSHSKAYRIFRHVLRLVLVGGITFGAIIGTSRYQNFDRAMADAGGGAIVLGLLAVIAMHFIFPMLDRRLFPVMDSKTAARAKKYAGMSEDEIYDVRNAKFHGVRNFFIVWFAMTMGLSFLVLRDVSVFLLGVVCFAVCYAMRRKWFFKRTNELLEQNKK